MPFKENGNATYENNPKTKKLFHLFCPGNGTGSGICFSLTGHEYVNIACLDCLAAAAAG